MNWSLVNDYLSYADLLKRKGDGLKAKENLGQAIETFWGVAPTGGSKKAEKELAELSYS